MIYKQTAESSICSTLSRTSRRLINRSKQHLSKKISVVSFHIILIYTYLYVITVVKMSKCAYVHPSLVARSVQLMCYSFNHLEFNCQFPYKRSILCQCLKINWNNICCYYINLIYNVCVFLLLLLFFSVYYCKVMSVWSGQDVSFLFFVWADFYCLCCYYGLPALLSQWFFFVSLSYLTNKYACLLACNYSAASNNMKLVHFSWWVQRGGDWAGRSPPRHSPSQLFTAC